LREPQTCNEARHRLAIGSVRGHSIESVSHRNNAGKKRNFFSGQAVWVTTSVNALVVVAYDFRNLGIVFHARENPLADDRMLLHLPALFER
jgi:hypothetical protein